MLFQDLDNMVCSAIGHRRIAAGRSFVQALGLGITELQVATRAPTPYQHGLSTWNRTCRDLRRSLSNMTSLWGLICHLPYVVLANQLRICWRSELELSFCPR